MTARARSRVCALALRAALAVAAVAAGCATLASPGAGDVDLPNAGAGPFRVLRTGEVKGHLAPYVADSSGAKWREPSVLDVDGDPATLDVEVYAASGPDASSRIVRFVADDGRSLSRNPPVALTATEGWEGTHVGSPCAVRVGGETWLYYAAEGGIGLARGPASGGDAGPAFTKVPGPVLGAEGAAAWESAAPPGEPGVVRGRDGSFHLFYAAGGSIGEATSSDGLHFARASGPVLAPSATPASAPSDGGVDEPFDDVRVGHPAPVLATSATGRELLRVYYGAEDRLGRRGVGLAAREGESGALTRATAPALTTNYSPTAPSVVVFDRFALLYFSQHAGLTPVLAYDAVAVGVAPATVSLVEPDAGN